jgi:soluble lytic murein transglycosylase-like protein
MLKRIALTTSLAVSSVTTGLHFVSHGYVKLENYAIAKANSYYSNTVAGLAKDLGYEKAAPPMPEADRLSRIKLYCTDIGKVPFSLSKAVMMHESDGDQWAKSPAGAMSLMQVMPANAKLCGLQSPNQLWDEESNIKCGCHLLSEAYKNHTYTTRNGKKIVDTLKVLQEYNAGIQNIGKSSENRDYPYLVLAELE